MRSLTIVYWWALLILFSGTIILNDWNSSYFWCHGLSASSALSLTMSSLKLPTFKLSSVSKSQLAVLDGAEWNSVQAVLKEEGRLPSMSTKYGYMKVVTGRDETNRRVIGMQCLDDDEKDNQNSDGETFVFEDSVAKIPDQVSETDAIATYITSISTIHCALPKLENVAGGSDTIATGKAVVLGSSDIACFAAEGLASLGIEVFLVNNKGSANVHKNVEKIEIIKPLVGRSDTGFSSHLGQFDSLIDTVGNERSATLNLDDPLIDEDDDFNDVGLSFGSSVLQLLKSRHNCHRYISTLTHCQNVVANEGIFGGPGKAEEYSQKVGSLSFLTESRECQRIPPPKAVGRTLETLMGEGVIFTEKQRKKTCTKKSDAIRGWSLSDFWEQTSWPRDSSGTGTVRFGLPVRDDFDIEENEFMISESPYRKEQAKKVIDSEDDYDEIGKFASMPPVKSSSAKNKAIQNNPYVLNILGVDGVQSEIVDNKIDCIIFMSAKFCKTCRSINPIFTRMARLNQENEKSNISFVKAETSGAMGKALGRHLSVRAVPSFVFFRKGQQFGIPLSVSKLPSPKINRALELLATGSEWDNSILDDEDMSSLE